MLLLECYYFLLFMYFKSIIMAKSFLCICKKFKYILFCKCKCAWIISWNWIIPDKSFFPTDWYLDIYLTSTVSFEMKYNILWCIIYGIQQCLCSLVSCNIRYMMLYKQKQNWYFTPETKLSMAFSLLHIDRMLVYNAWRFSNWISC